MRLWKKHKIKEAEKIKIDKIRKELDVLLKQNEVYKHYVYIEKTLQEIIEGTLALPNEEHIAITSHGKSMYIWKDTQYLVVDIEYYNEKIAKFSYNMGKFEAKTKISVEKKYIHANLKESSKIQNIMRLMKMIAENQTELTTEETIQLLKKEVQRNAIRNELK